MRHVLVTGASGFLGRAVVAALRARGVAVTALSRRGGADSPGLTWIACDLALPEAVPRLRAALAGCDAVVHAAAHMGGDARAHARDTDTATRHVLQAMQGKALPMVLVSSLAVYDMDALRPGDALTEDSALLRAPRDAYSGAKLGQETALRASAQPAWILRPGVIWGPGRTWHALMGTWLGKLHLGIAADGPLPLTHVTHCAEAVAQAALTRPEGLTALNVFDDDLPSRRVFLREHRRQAGWPRLALPLPFGLWMGLARVTAPLGPRRPGLLQPSVLRARALPLRYPNAALRRKLGGKDHAPFAEMLAHSLKDAQ